MQQAQIAASKVVWRPLRILVIGGIAKSLINFRGALLRSMVSAGYSVEASANGRDHITENKLQQMGIAYYPIQLDRAGMNPFNDIKTLIDLIQMISRLKPDILLSYSIKPVIYSGLAARLCGVPYCYSLITGLGYTFRESESMIQLFSKNIASQLYKYSLKKSRKVFFQNPDDQRLFIEKGLVEPSQAVLIHGSGIDLDYFPESQLPMKPNFLMISRLLVDKGVKEYVKAAEIFGARFPQTRFMLVGNLDANPNSVRKRDLMKWKQEGTIEHIESLDDVRPIVQKCRYYVFPSYYREGIPRTVLEAMATGRPIITTDAPGCRETIRLTLEGQRQRDRGDRVIQGENGFLVRPRDIEALITAMKLLLEAPGLAEKMAKRSREIAEEKYDVHKVNEVILSAMGLLCP